MADVLAGCLLDRLPNPRALAAARFFEYAPRLPLPTLATLARIRKQAAAGSRGGEPAAWPQIALVAPRSTWTSPRGPLRAGPELDAGVEWLTRVSDILSAFAIVLATGAELSTGARDRDLLASFVERLKPTGRTIVIAPRGLWEPEHAIPFAAQIGALYGFDPLEHDAPEGDVIYARVRPMGARPRLTDGHLAQVAERITNAESVTAYVAIESDQCIRETKRLHIQLADLDDLPDDEDDEDDEESEDEESEDEESEDDADDEA
ncbi:MAG: hypothetical protein RLZZ450_2839 [Pseudomonadota bacterium]|jgi:hypothetical protein